MNAANIHSLINQTSAMLAPYASRVAERLHAGETSGLSFYESAGEIVLSYPSTPLASIATAKVGTARARKLASIARRLGALCEAG